MSKPYTIKTQFMTYPVRLSDVLRILISAMVVCLNALALVLALALRVEALASALALRFWHDYIAGSPMPTELGRDPLTCS